MSPTHEWFTPTVVESGSGLETVPSKRKSRSLIVPTPATATTRLTPGRVVVRDGHRRARIAHGYRCTSRLRVTALLCDAVAVARWTWCDCRSRRRCSGSGRRRPRSSSAARARSLRTSSGKYPGYDGAIDQARCVTREGRHVVWSTGSRAFLQTNGGATPEGVGGVAVHIGIDEINLSGGFIQTHFITKSGFRCIEGYGPPFDVEDPVGRNAAGGSKDTATGAVRSLVVPMRHDRVGEGSKRQGRR